MVKSLSRIIASGNLRVIVYARVSEDRQQGRSVAEQFDEGAEDLAELAEELGVEITIVARRSDNDVGASEFSVGDRPGWEQVLQSMQAGEVDMLWTWEHSRGDRTMDGYMVIRRACMAERVLWRYSGRTYDMSDWRDRKATGNDALEAEAESARTSERVRRTMRREAAKGMPHGRRLFGYRRVRDVETGKLLGQEIDPWEASIVRWIYAQYLAGTPRNTIAQALNRTSILYWLFAGRSLLRPATKGPGQEERSCHRWSNRQVDMVLRQPGYTGRRSHKGTVKEDPTWPAIIGRDKWDMAQARLAAAPLAGRRQFLAAHLLTGLARCGRCGSRMGINRIRSGIRMYACKAKWHLSRQADPLEAWVSALLLERLANPDTHMGPRGEDPAVEAARRQKEELRDRLDEAWGLWDKGSLSTEAYARMETKLRGQMDEMDRAERQALVPMDVTIPEEGLEEWWLGLPLEIRREILAAFVESIVVLPVGKGVRGFDHADYTRVEWRR